MRVQPIWEVPAAGQFADFTSDLDRPSFGTPRDVESAEIDTPPLVATGEELLDKHAAPRNLIVGLQEKLRDAEEDDHN